MRVFIPEIGTVIRLIEPWSFDLHYESRNENLLKALGLLLPHEQPTTRTVYNPTTQQYEYHAVRETVWLRPDQVGTVPRNYRGEELDRWYTGSWYENRWDGKERRRPAPAQAVIPAGTRLVVDRLYIRKGKDEYSSVTFRTEHLGGTEGQKKSPKPRFWVKLADVNTGLHVEVVSVPPTGRPKDLETPQEEPETHVI